MTFKLDIDNNFVGPKALFDPNYIPPHLLHRKKELNSLISILNDSISDKFSLNILYQGINGIGKKATNEILEEYDSEEEILEAIDNKSFSVGGIGFDKIELIKKMLDK